MRSFLFTLMIWMLALPVLADEGRSDSVLYTLPEQTITGSRIEQPWQNNPTAITAINFQDQPKVRGLGLGDNLFLVPGLVALSRFGTDDIRLSLRGMGARSNTGVRGVRVLYDGIPESEPDGQTRLEGIEVGNLDRVEVLRGGGSALYGNAAGGVLNLRTAETFPRPGIKVDAVAGAFGFSKIKLSAGTGPAHTDSTISAFLDLRDFDFSFEEGRAGEGGNITVSHTKADGWRDHSRYEGQIVSGSWSAYGTPKSELRALMYFTNVSADLPGTLTKEQFEADPNQAESRFVNLDVRRATRKGRFGIHYRRHLSRDLNFDVTPYVALKKLDRVRENALFQAITRYILGGTAQASWKAERPNFETEVVAGTDQQLQDGPVSWYPNVNGNKGDSLLTQEQERQYGQGYFVQWDVERPEHYGATLGLRYDHVYFYDEYLNEPIPTLTYRKDAITPRLSLRYVPRPNITVFSALYGGFETPTLSETDNTIGYDLKPQKTLTVELGARTRQTMAGALSHAELTLYRMAVTDAIVPDEIEGERLFTNAAEAVHQGVEISFKIEKPRLGYAGLSASLGEFKFTDYKTGLGDYTDKKLPGVSPDLFGAVVRWMPRDFFFAELTARFSGAAYANIVNDEKADSWMTLGATIGGKVPANFLSASWFVGIQNITDEKYVSFIQVNDSRRRYYESGMPQAILGGISIGTPGL